jgi:MYXO-CTERM domain-containing protein
VDREHPLAATLAGNPRQTYDPNPLGFPPGESPVWFVDRDAWEKAGGATVGAVGKEGSGEAVVEDPADCATPAVRPPIRRDHDHESRPMALADFPPLARRVAYTGVFEPGVDCEELAGTNVGVLPLGEGTIHVFGAILPDPSEAANHPYGLDNHAVSTAGNRLLLAMMGMDFTVSATPAEETLGKASVGPDAPGEAPVPFPGVALLLGALGLVALRRRR